MKAVRALKEVWDWKNSLYKGSKDKTVHGIAETIRKEEASLKELRVLRRK